jgi:hypothetical protein
MLEIFAQPELSGLGNLLSCHKFDLPAQDTPQIAEKC